MLESMRLRTWTKRRLAAITKITLAGFVCLGISPGQTAGSLPSFEVASAKPSAAPGRSEVAFSPGGLTIRHSTLTLCVALAYEVKFDQITRPAWLDSEAYDITAKSAAPSTEKQIRLMLQALLADRFKLALHRETKSLERYEMTVGKGGPKLTTTNSDDTPGVQARRDGYDFTHTTMSLFAGRLNGIGAVDIPVVDHTGLEGAFDISLRFPNGWRPRPGVEDTSGLSIFSILEQQLGLKLELRKLPTEILVIDHAEKTPTEN